MRDGRVRLREDADGVPSFALVAERRQYSWAAPKMEGAGYPVKKIWSLFSPSHSWVRQRAGAMVGGRHIEEERFAWNWQSLPRVPAPPCLLVGAYEGISRPITLLR
jgi:hypothetical protein